MKRCLALLCLAGCAAAAQPPHSDNPSNFLFNKSDSAAARRSATRELSRNPHDLNAWFIRMEAARMQLQSREQLWAAIRLLNETRNNQDPRAQLAAERIRELAANTPQFRRAIPELSKLLLTSRYARQLSDALLAARADGIQLPRSLHLTPRVTEWQVAGPFGEFSNVDFDRSWPPEQDSLGKNAYEALIREDIRTESGELELPEYFSRTGVYYAASNLHITRLGKYTLTVESGGTYQIFAAGKSLLLHDGRYRAQRTISHLEVTLPAGTHRLLVKLQPSALPLRIWFHPVNQGPAQNLLASEAGRVYLNAATSLNDGDEEPALSLTTRNSSIANLVHAEALSRIGAEQESKEALAAALAADPNNLKARYELALQAFSNENFEEAAAQLSPVIKFAPAYWPGQELKYQLADHFGWAVERNEALSKRIQLHPACGALEDAIKLDENESTEAAKLEARLATCAPAPYRYWEHLAARGLHAQVVTSIETYVVKQRQDRRALKMGIREAVLAHNQEAATRLVERLGTVAPNWEWVKTLARNPEGILDSPSASFGTDEFFYKSFVREALPAMANASGREDQVLLNDRVVKLDASGDAWVYQHTLTQVFDKKGIEEVGEVELPHAVDVLVLRTINRDGTFVEPEINDNKSTVSMPSLGEGDAVEIGYVQHFGAESLRANPEQLDFVFGTPDFLTRSARITMINEGAPEPLLWPAHGTKETHFRSGNSRIVSWEMMNVPPPPQEPASAHYQRQPAVLWLQMDRSQAPNTAERYRDDLVNATKITPKIERVAASIHGPTPEQRVAAAYQRVMASIDNDSQSWTGENLPSADESFGQGEGSRPAALISLLAALGFEADLELAAERGHYDPLEGCPEFRCYTHPLVRVRISGSKKPVLLDPQMDGLAAGALSPEVEGEPALLIARESPVEVTQVTVPRLTNQQSVATADLKLDVSGAVRGTIHVRLGSWRGAQMRQTLRQLSSKDREAYFEEIAGRILPNVRTVSAIVRHEEDPDSPLDLDLAVTASSLAHWTESEFEIGQLIPALALSRLYTALPERHEELLVEVPLIERSEFLLHLPEGVEPAHLPESVSLKSNFGEYHTEFGQIGSQLRIVREFRIPVQEIGAAIYPAFAKFALQIDSAERDAIRLRRNAVAQNTAAAIQGRPAQ